MLIVEGGHLVNLVVFEHHIGTVPKGCLFSAIAFSLLVEFFNVRIRPKSGSKQVKLNTYAQEAADSTEYARVE